MNNLPNCPICGEDSLYLCNYATKDGLHYSVGCDACGIAFHHEGFYGYNQVMKFFEDAGRGRCEDVGGDDEFTCSHCGYTHDYTPEELKDPKAFSFCPTCGFEVER